MLLLDKNECILDTYDCHESQSCSNTEGSYECVCLAGQEFKDGQCQGENPSEILILLAIHNTECCEYKIMYIFYTGFSSLLSLFCCCYISYPCQ